MKAAYGCTRYRMANQKELDTMTSDQVMDHFLNSLRDFCACFREAYINGMFWPDTFVVG